MSAIGLAHRNERPRDAVNVRGLADWIGVDMPDRTCSVDGCEGVTGPPGSARGFCGKHYQRWLAHGDPAVVLTVTRGMPAIERFRRFIRQAKDGCWLWHGHVDRWGYGRFTAGDSRWVLAHRWSYEHFIGPIPDGLTIDHLCRVPRCVNPAHLEVVTMSENVKRSWRSRRLTPEGR